MESRHSLNTIEFQKKKSINSCLAVAARDQIEREGILGSIRIVPNTFLLAVYIHVSASEHGVFRLIYV
jgi:hypothetical protein